MNDEKVRYSVRWSSRARRDLERAVVDYADYIGDNRQALKMLDEIEQLAGSLQEDPDRYTIGEKESEAFGFPVRRVLYRLRKSKIAYHLIYFAVEQSPDGPTVSIVHVRHASRAPLTSDEASDIKNQQ